MSYDYSNTQKRTFKHLTPIQRGKIEALLKQKVSVAAIAIELKVHRSTIYREIKRGTVEQLDSNLKKHTKYFAETGQIVYEKNRINSRPPLKLLNAYDFVSYADNLMLKYLWSPNMVCGRAKLEGIFSKMVCAKTLYNYIDQGLLKTKNIDLANRVSRKTKQIRVRNNRKVLGKSIEMRDITREEFGHWEIDTVIGKRGAEPVLLTLDERKTRKRHIIKIASKTSEAVRAGLQQIIASYGDLGPSVFKTITSDNGNEFSALTLDFPTIDVYYCHPYASFERGTNEKHNSLIRRFIPKGRSMNSYSPEAIEHIENWINDLPREIFGFVTAKEKFTQELELLNI